jgi:succinate-semialdehyde dehydrogenase / glutarate-semialdehyde dehydrogenase
MSKRDSACAQRMVSAWDSGMTGVDVGVISNAASPPFGDIKQSCIGREGGPGGLLEYPDVKYALFADPTLALGR